MESTWVATAKPNTYPGMTKDLRAEVVIIGGGMAGTSAAYFLAKAGVPVVLLDKGKLIESVTAYTTAFVRCVVDSSLIELQDLFGNTKAKAVWESSRDAVEMIAQNVEKEKIDCEFMRSSFYKYANTEDEWKELAEEIALAKQYGFDLKTGKSADIPMKNSGYFEVPNQVKYHPLKYLNALRAAAVEAGAIIYEETEAKSISGNGPFTVETAHGDITADKILIATYDPFNKPSELFAHKGIYTTYVIELEVDHEACGPEQLYEDSANPYHYLRIDAKNATHDRVILGGEDHRHELPLDEKKAQVALEEYFQKIFPAVSYKVLRMWSGPIIETIDGLPFIGQYDEERPGLFVATGFSGSGMTFGTMAGYMFAEFAQEHTVPWQEIYDPCRTITPRQFWTTGKRYAGEFLGAYVKNVVKDPDDSSPVAKKR